MFRSDDERLPTLSEAFSLCIG